jgi:hypothetical protein
MRLNCRKINLPAIQFPKVGSAAKVQLELGVQLECARVRPNQESGISNSGEKKNLRKSAQSAGKLKIMFWFLPA